MHEEASAAVENQRAPRLPRHAAGWDARAEQSKFRRWAAAMACGDFAQAWRINLAERRHWPSAHNFYDETLAPSEELTVYGLHGLGDIVQMMQYAKRMQALAQRITYVVPQSLELLMRHFTGVEYVRRLPESTPLTPIGNSAETMELPFLFRTVQSDLPIATHYLDPMGELRNRFARRFPRSTKTLRVGLAWEGSTWDTERWIPAEELAPLFHLRNVEFWHLQGSTAGRNLPFQPEEESGQGIEDMVGMMANLDVVLTIDSLSAHLAGALGIPAWILLKHEADWRWLRAGHQSLWYPTATLFRQPRPGDWKAVFAIVLPLLAALAEAARAGDEEALRIGLAKAH